MIFVKKFTSHSIRKDPVEVKYWVRIVEQPWRDRLWHEMYHWYDMRFPLRVPGFKHLKRGAPWKHNVPERRHAGGPTVWDRLADWSISQDFRCYHTSVKNLVVLAEFEVDEVTYKKI